MTVEEKIEELTKELKFLKIGLAVVVAIVLAIFIMTYSVLTSPLNINYPPCDCSFSNFSIPNFINPLDDALPSGGGFGG
jgi:hypothetical protein